MKVIMTNDRIVSLENMKTAEKYGSKRDGYGILIRYTNGDQAATAETKDLAVRDMWFDDILKILTSD